MAYSSTQNSSGSYDIYNNGTKVSTGSKAYADQMVSGNAVDQPPSNFPTQNQPAPAKDASVVSSVQGINTINQKTATLNNIAPPVSTTPTTDTTKKTSTDTTPSTTKITLLNPTTGQQSIFDDADLNKQNIQNLLGSGYKISETNGNLPSWLVSSTTGNANTPTGKAQADVESAASDLKSLSDNLSKYTVSDAQLQATIDSISAQWNVRIADMQRANASREGNINTLGVRLGSQYAGGSGGQFGGIVSEEERQGVTRIGELEASKQQAIAGARAAAASQNWQVYGKQVDLAQKAYEDKVSALKDLNNATNTQNNLIAKNLYDQVTKPIQDIALEAAKNGMSNTGAISGAKSVDEAIKAAGDYLQTATGTLGDYYQYKRDTESKGLVPQTYQDYKDAQDAKASKLKISEAYNTAYGTAMGKAAGDSSGGTSNKVQQGLEQQGRQIIAKEFSGRTGSLGIENAKVNQANHLNSLFSQYYDSKTGNYNIPSNQYNEIAIGLANLVSGTGQVGETTIANINAATAAGDFNKAIQYATGSPQNGNTQAMIKNALDSVDRQAQTAIRNRQAALDNMKDLLPTDLEQSRKDALIKATNMVGYEGQDRISKSNIDEFLGKSGSKMVSMSDGEHSLYYLTSELYKTPGATNQNVEAYLKANGFMQ